MMGDLNWDMNNLEHKPIFDFCETYVRKNPTCYKNADIPSSIDFILKQEGVFL